MRDYLKEFKDYCLTCEEYDIYSKGDSTHRGFRCKHHHRPMAFDESCSSYHKDKARGNFQIEEAVSFRVKKGYEPKPDSSYWYVVSSVCKICSSENMEENNKEKYLQAFATFKNQLLTYPNGVEFLGNYDVNGLRLANLLLDGYQCEETKEQTIAFIITAMLPILEEFASMVQQNNHSEALKVYMRLLNILTMHYGYSPVSEVESSPELIGQGRVSLLLQSVE